MSTPSGITSVSTFTRRIVEDFSANVILSLAANAPAARIGFTTTTFSVLVRGEAVAERVKFTSPCDISTRAGSATPLSSFSSLLPLNDVFTLILYFSLPAEVMSASIGAVSERSDAESTVMITVALLYSGMLRMRPTV